MHRRAAAVEMADGIKGVNRSAGWKLTKAIAATKKNQGRTFVRPGLRTISILFQFVGEAALQTLALKHTRNTALCFLPT
jgi:hypothetical protein